MIKIVLTGPESSGKTTLGRQLADHFQTNYVSEYARQYLNGIERDYEKKDLIEIAKKQIESESILDPHSNHLLFCDTDLITIKVWSDYKYKETAPWILQQIDRRYYDLYLLCVPDIPWEEDPQRENPDDRDALFEIYKNTLLEYNKNFVEIKGSFEERLNTAIEQVNQYLKH